MIFNQKNRRYENARACDRVYQRPKDQDEIYRPFFDKTVFYPMGGGQATDQGVVIFDSGIEGNIYQVLQKDGEINYYVKMDNEPHINQKIHGKII